MTESQQRIIDQINSSGKFEVMKTEDNKYFLSATVETKEKHFFLKQYFHLFIGKRGGIKVVHADRAGDSSDRRVMSTITALFGYKVFNRPLKLTRI